MKHGCKAEAKRAASLWILLPRAHCKYTAVKMGNMSNEKTLPNSKHADDQASLDKGTLQQIQESSFAFSSAAEKRLVRKIDIMYVLCNLSAIRY
jgi:hypothetical protein